MERMYTLKQIAGNTGFNIQTVRRMCRDGTLKAVKIGREWRVPASALEPKREKETKHAS